MADTIPDIPLTQNTDWEDLNTLSGIPAGSGILISNKSSYPIRLQLAATKPDADSDDGEVMAVFAEPLSQLQVSVGENIVWGKVVAAPTKTVRALISIQAFT